MPVLKSILSFLFLLTFCFGYSQVKQPVIKTIVKFKPPVVKTFLGRNTGTATVTTEEGNQLVGLPLRITDDKNIAYPVTTYQFMYKKRSIIENETTGKKEVAWSTTADRFNASPLPQIWRTNISGGLQKGEELYFFDILVKDKQNRTFFAPDIKIIVQ